MNKFLYKWSRNKVNRKNYRVKRKFKTEFRKVKHFKKITH